MLGQNRLCEASPLGFYAGDTNLYRFVGDDPTDLVDPTGLKSRSYWQQKANDVIGWKEGGNNPGPIEMNRRITAAYAEMYLRDPSKFAWAGMAAFASQEVGEGMKSAEVLIEEAGSIGLLYGVTLGLAWFFVGVPNGTDLLNALKTGNLGVYQDIYWMHLAYYPGM